MRPLSWSWKGDKAGNTVGRLERSSRTLPRRPDSGRNICGGGIAAAGPDRVEVTGNISRQQSCDADPDIDTIPREGLALDAERKLRRPFERGDELLASIQPFMRPMDAQLRDNPPVVELEYPREPHTQRGTQRQGIVWIDHQIETAT